jgi:signal transduction histidine kinase
VTVRRKRVRASRPVPPVLPVNETSVRMALEAAGMVTWEWNLETGLIRYSDNMPGLVRGERFQPFVTVASLLPTLHPEDRDRLARALERTKTEGCPFECEYRVRMLDGKYYWILGKGKTVVMEKGKPVRVLGISQDITARKHAEEELKRRSRQLAELASKLVMVEHRERRRLADLLHEDLQQLVVGARIQVHTLLEATRGANRRRLDVLQEALGEILDLSRSITKDLAPPVFPQKDLAVTFQWLVNNILQRQGLEVSVRMSRTFKSINEIRIVLLFTAARELLLNVVKHAGVKHAELFLWQRSGGIELEVRDDGKGFDLQNLKMTDADPGFGLFSIRERAELLGGKLTIASTPGQGTRVVLALPLSATKIKGAG